MDKLLQSGFKNGNVWLYSERAISQGVLSASIQVTIQKIKYHIVRGRDFVSCGPFLLSIFSEQERNINDY
jgi:hypothetical protein